jgi:ribosomal protein S2
MRLLFPTFLQLLNTGVHIGCSVKNTIFYAAWMLFIYRNNTWFIAISKYVYMLKIAFYTINNVVNAKAPFWFVNNSGIYAAVLKTLASKCGEFACGDYWIRGMLSNYLFVFASYKSHLHDSMFTTTCKRSLFRTNYDNWLLTRFSWPRAIFVTNSSESIIALKECMDANTPCIALNDTNLNSRLITIPLPSNDNSMQCLIFHNDLIARFVLVSKLNAVSSWYYNIRNKKRLVSFDEWVFKKSIIGKKVYQQRIFVSSNVISPLNLFNVSNILRFSKIIKNSGLIDTIHVYDGLVLSNFKFPLDSMLIMCASLCSYERRLFFKKKMFILRAKRKRRLSILRSKMSKNLTFMTKANTYSGITKFFNLSIFLDKLNPHLMYNSKLKVKNTYARSFLLILLLKNLYKVLSLRKRFISGRRK